jgi:hypothetical protein
MTSPSITHPKPDPADRIQRDEVPDATTAQERFDLAFFRLCERAWQEQQGRDAGTQEGAEDGA